MKEIEAVVNTRPLTCVDTELEHILKPSDFLTVGKCITMKSAQEGSSLQGTVTKRELVKGWKRALKILEEFKEMFSNRYLPSLRERYWNSHKEPRVTSKTVPCEGQIVQIKGDSHNREGWRVGKIVELIKGADGLCRVAKVKIGNKEFTRSISHLYPLEIENTEIVAVPETQTDNESVLKSPVVYDVDYNESSEEDVIYDVAENTENAELDKPEKENENNDIITQKSNDISVENNQKHDDSVLTDIDRVHEVGSSLEDRPKRGAATRALEKIKEWTRNLVTLLQ